jgi:hypothetical protein
MWANDCLCGVVAQWIGMVWQKQWLFGQYAAKKSA